jgi:hypothetical protein
MTTAAQTITRPASPLQWFGDFLKEELAPYPEREAVVARAVLAAAIVMILTMVFRMPYGAYAALYAVTISRENPQSTVPQQAPHGADFGNTPNCERLRLHNHAFSDEFWKHIANCPSPGKGYLLDDEGLSISRAFEKRSPLHSGRACYRRGRPQCCELHDTCRNDGLERHSRQSYRDSIRAVRLALACSPKTLRTMHPEFEE